jgi:hypothetical protein
MTSYDSYLSASPRRAAETPFVAWIDARVGTGWSVCRGGIA